MSYNPHHYKHLFKRGLENLPDRDFENWNQSHRLFALNQEPQEEVDKILAPGLRCRCGSFPVASGFVNYLSFEVDLGLRQLTVLHSYRPVYPLRAFERLNGAKVLLNLGYFYLSTYEDLDPVPPPRIRAGGLVVSRGRLVGLPILDRSALLIFRDGLVAARLLKAQGWVSINGRRLTWVGSKTHHRGEVVVYTSSNIEIKAQNHPVVGPFREAQATYATPHLGKKLIICQIKRGQVRVTRVQKTKALINSADLILEVPSSLKASRASRVCLESIDGINLKDLSQASSLGPILRSDPQSRQDQIRQEGLAADAFLSNSPHREDLRLARGCLVPLPQNRLATVSIDGIPQADEIYPGVTPQELHDFVAKLFPDRQEVVCTDPSNTLKVIYKNSGRTHVFGNTHYLAYRRLKNGRLKFWPNGRNGRKVPTMLVVR